VDVGNRDSRQLLDRRASEVRTKTVVELCRYADEKYVFPIGASGS
jgi:hypothetical protein